MTDKPEPPLYQATEAAYESSALTFEQWQTCQHKLDSLYALEADLAVLRADNDALKVMLGESREREKRTQADLAALREQLAAAEQRAKEWSLIAVDVTEAISKIYPSPYLAEKLDKIRALAAKEET